MIAINFGVKAEFSKNKLPIIAHGWTATRSSSPLKRQPDRITIVRAQATMKIETAEYLKPLSITLHA